MNIAVFGRARSHLPPFQHVNWCADQTTGVDRLVSWEQEAWGVVVILVWRIIIIDDFARTSWSSGTSTVRRISAYDY